MALPSTALSQDPAVWRDPAPIVGNTIRIDSALAKRISQDTLRVLAQIRATEQFIDRLDRLKDLDGRARIQARIERLAAGNPGKYRALKHGYRN